MDSETTTSSGTDEATATGLATEGTASLDEMVQAVRRDAAQASTLTIQAGEAQAAAASAAKSAEASETEAATAAAASAKTADELAALLKKLQADVEAAAQAAATAREQAREATAAAEAASKQRTDAEAASSTAQQAAKSAREEQTKAQSSAKASETDRKQTEQLALDAGALRTTITSEEARLDAVVKKAEELEQTLERMLPGTTSAGLASSFLARKSDFDRPRRYWAVMSVGAICVLIAVAAFGPHGFWEFVVGGSLSWQSLALGVLWRLPLAAGLVWLALHASHHHQAAVRLQEDYAFKEALSRAFEGYKRELATVKERANAVPLLETFCANVLAALAEPPGRLYDKPTKYTTPLHALLSAMDRKELEAIAKELNTSPETLTTRLLTLFRKAKP